MDGHPWLTVFSVIVFVVLLGVAVRIAWREWRPDFEAQYGEARGREFLALFLISFPAFVVVHLMDKHIRRRKTAPDDR